VTTLRLLGDGDVQAAIDYDKALEIARRTLRDQAEGRAILSSPSAMMLDAASIEGPKAKFKAAAVGHLGASGIRLLAHPSPTEEAHNYCAVFDHETTMLSGLVAERWLSRMRTAAFGAVSIEPLVNPGPLVIALFGAGGISKEMVPLIARTLQVREMRVNSRRPERTAAFVAEHAPTVKFPMHAEPDGRRAVSDADLVITLTESPSPLVFPGTLKPGAVVCSMGSYNEVDYGVLVESQRLVVDDADFAAEMGDGGAWISQGHLSREEFKGRIDALACEVIAGKKSGRRSPSDRIVALIQGMATGDVAFAAYALREAQRTGKGAVIALP
jgi:ornithine cyclodeaminase/alanine dehydrogenase-like protein (mu-crystallin family)